MVLTLTWYSFQELSFLAIAHRAILAAMEAVAFSVVDSIVSNAVICMQNRTDNTMIHQLHYRYTVTGCILLWRWYSFPSGSCSSAFYAFDLCKPKSKRIKYSIIRMKPEANRVSLLVADSQRNKNIFIPFRIANRLVLRVPAVARNTNKASLGPAYRNITF